ncbi:MAG: TonB-dependent receptor family protein [Gemmatimonadaceae bacterium]
MHNRYATVAASAAQLLTRAPITSLPRTVIFATIVVGSPIALRAQQPAPRSVPRDTTTPVLAPVRVTVLRTPFDVTHAPVDVAGVSEREATVARPGFALDEVLAGLGGVQVDNRLNFALGERISIRGVGARSQFGVRGVRVIVDDIPATLADGQTELNNVDLGSLGGAEVIRGPASSLYGNGSGGVVMLQSRPAPLTPFVPSLRLMRGADALSRVQFGAGGTQGRATYTVNGDRLDYGGYRRYSDARNAHLNVIGTYDWDRVALKVVANAVQYNAKNPGSLSDSLLRIDRRQAFANNVVQRTGKNGKQGQLGVSTRIRTGAGELRLSGYELQRSLENPIPPRVIALHRSAGGVRAAYALTRAVSTGSVTAIVGGDADLQRDDRQNWINTRGARGALVLNQFEHVTSASPFVQVTALAGRATFLAGVRHDHLRFGVDDHLVTSTNPDDSGERLLSATSPSFGASYAVLPVLTLYANVATGFQTPTTTELANRPSGAGGFNPALEPEHVHSREGGVKGRAASVTYSAALYQMRIDGELIPFELASAPGRQFYRNAGAARHRGVDADLSVALTPWLVGRAGYGYTDARFISYALGGTSYAGNQVPGVAPHAGTVSLQLGDPASRFVAVEERAESATPVNDANTARSAGYAVTNIRGEVTLGDVLLFGGLGNIFGKLYNTSVVINAAAARYYEPAAGRNLYLGFGLTAR